MGESELNTLEYQLLSENKVGEATQVFLLNTVQYPSSSNAFDSLGEAYSRGNQHTLAVTSYPRAVDLDPTNLHTIAMLKKLRDARP